MAAGLRRLAALSGIGTALALAPCAHAAVGICGEELGSKLAAAPTELEAKRSALDSWREGARLLGEGYTRWEIAWRRRIECTRLPDGRFQCQALGRPCTIQQVPPPPGEFYDLRRAK